MQLIPSALIPAARAFLASQGQNPAIFTDSGELDGGALASILYNQVEIHTNATPPLIFPIGPGGPPADSVTNELLKALQPSVILSGPAGRVALAPYGEAPGATSWVPIALVGGAIILGIGWLVWK